MPVTGLGLCVILTEAAARPVDGDRPSMRHHPLHGIVAAPVVRLQAAGGADASFRRVPPTGRHGNTSNASPRMRECPKVGGWTSTRSLSTPTRMPVPASP
jgi:hypothetical protein